MIRANVQKTYIGLFVLGMLSLGLWFFSSSASTQIPPPKISVEQQTGSPLLISSTYINPSDPFKPQYSYTITNVSDKHIRAYAIKEDIRFANEGVETSGAVLSILPSLNLLLQPNQSRSINKDNGEQYTHAINEVTLSVDFIEFSDGSTWGNDSFKSAERLAGRRAGGKAAIKKFREKLATGGLNALTDAITQDNIVDPDPLIVSQDWREGFRAGVGVVRNRLKEAKGGLAGVAKELEKPFDASDGRQEQ
ncbi:MAG TPA: hypothetical protein VGX92_01855 [Pyrinomonadaceae bacterium]|jgi:hypothetical protein|nr:hypothetical protein [Pyrinomonadaceae bacterium]